MFGFAWALAIAAAGPSTLSDCQRLADEWCTSSRASGDGTSTCSAVNMRESSGRCGDEKYVARLGRGSPQKDQLALQWRCYAESVAANATNTNHANACYCTRQDELRDMLTLCQQRVAPASLVFSSAHPPLAPVGTPPYTMVRIPALLVTRSGTLLAFGTARRGGGGDYAWNDLILRRSFDEGLSWGEVQLLPGDNTSGPATVDNPCPIWDDVHNRTVLVFMSDGKRMLLMTSEDDGESWSVPRDISRQGILDPATHPDWSLVYTGPPGGVQMSAGSAHPGRLVCPSHHARANNAGAGGTDASYAIYSDDFGETWNIGADVTLPGFSGENQLVELRGGELLTSLRVNGAWDGSYHLNRTHLFARSTDGGASWHKAYAATPDFPEVNCEGSLIVQPFAGAQTGQRLLWSGILGGGIGSLSDPRTGMVLRASVDGGITWPESTLVWAGLADYSSLQLLRSGRVGLLYTRNASAGETVFQLLPGLSV